MPKLQNDTLTRTNGFDILRLALAFGVLAFHSYTLSTGSITGMPWQVQAAARLLLPAFFALSGYLISGSLMRAPSPIAFVGLRLLRLGPALLVVTILSVFVLGPLLGVVPITRYLAAAQTWRYFTNLVGQTQFYLPGLFVANARAGVVNGSLWTIPLEIKCYLAVALCAAAIQGRARVGILVIAGGALVTPGIAELVPAPALLLAFVCGALLHQLCWRLPAWIAPLLVIAAWWLAARDCAACALPLSGAVAAVGQLNFPRWPRADYSYGLYLVGFPVEQALLQIMRGLVWWQVLLLATPAASLLAAGLWHGVERPVLRRKHRALAFARSCLPWPAAIKGPGTDPVA